MQKLLAIEMGYKNAILLIMDIPYLAKNEYSVVEGIAQGNSKKARKAAESRTVMIQTEEKEEIWIDIAGGTGDIREGDWLKVVYLPNSHYGCVVKHEEK